MNRWKIEGGGIVWEVGDSHRDDIEMAGTGVSYILAYGADENGSLYMKRHVVWPTLRTIPNNTHASYQQDISDELIPAPMLDGVRVTEKAKRFTLDGVVTAESVSEDGGLEIKRVCFPSASDMTAHELVTVKNITDKAVALSLGSEPFVLNSFGRGTKGVYLTEIICSHIGGEIKLNAGEEYTYALTYMSRIANTPALSPNSYQASVMGVTEKLYERRRRVSELCDPLSLDTGDIELDTMFRMSKLRAGESIFKTAGGYLHSPGGFSYYAATWCNDQIEYSGPWFAYTGDKIELEAALNAYMEYVPFMSEQYISIPSSVIAEGTDIWEKDRGDEAMFAFGASLYALTRGDRVTAEKLYPAIKWCVEYCLRRKNDSGVILSESDELEGRFPTGEANLSTSTLCCGGMRYASYLARDLGRRDDSEWLAREADTLEGAIEAYFGGELHGYKTYRYYDGNTVLRSWICLPLCMGIRTRLEGTVGALTSPYLWTRDGLLTEEGSKTVWDRSTLYGFRGAYLGGANELITPYFKAYIERRLLGERVPYAIEAYPEGSMRHLSGESSLFCRIVTDGILGIMPRGLHSFAFTPRLPAGLDHLYLRGIKAFGGEFDILVEKDGCKVVCGGKTLSECALDSEAVVNI